MTLACPLAAEESATARIFELVCLRAFQRWIVLQVCTWYFELILLTWFVCWNAAWYVLLLYLEVVVVKCALIAVRRIHLARRHSCYFVAFWVWRVSTSSWCHSYLGATFYVFYVVAADALWSQHLLAVEIGALSHGFALSVSGNFWRLHVAGCGWRQTAAVSRRLDRLQDVLAARLAWFRRRRLRYVWSILWIRKDIIVCLKLRRNIKLIFHILLEIMTPVAFRYHRFRNFTFYVVHSSCWSRQRKLIRI